MSAFRAKGFAALAAVAALSLLIAPVAQAKKKKISFSVSKRYTAIALAANGKASSVKKSGKVALTPKASNVTLHLVNPDGTYEAMVVTGKVGKKMVSTCVKAGASLGRLKVRGGYATPSAKQRGPFACSSFKAQAKGGKPTGAGVFGLTDKCKKKGSNGSGKDQDQDGLPGAFDVDDNCNGIIDNFESNTGRGARAASAGFDDDPPPGGGPGSGPGGQSDTLRIFSNLKVDMEKSLNANAGTVTTEQIDNLVSSSQGLAIQVVGGGTVELNCTGLSYCSAGGTGKNLSDSSGGSPTDAPAFPGSYDTDGDGFGTIAAGSTGDFQLSTGATSSEIRSGDTMIEVVDGSKEIPGILNFAFITTPALQSWSTSEDSGTVAYPVNMGSVGTNANPIQVPADGRLTLTYWRPQRLAIPGAGEGTGYVDIGHLMYTADVPNNPSSGGGDPGRGPGNCSAASYSTTDSNLVIGAEAPVDQLDDRAADPANTLTFTVDLNTCFGSTVWSSGQQVSLDIQARTADGDNSAQKILLRRK